MAKILTNRSHVFAIFFTQASCVQPKFSAHKQVFSPISVELPTYFSKQVFF
jgi:hypothetical protein